MIWLECPFDFCCCDAQTSFKFNENVLQIGAQEGTRTPTKLLAST